MVLQKDFKRLVRGRMRKTGESYTTARAHLRRKRAPGEVPAPPRPDYAALAGMKDSSIEAKTGRSWAGWVDVLDPLDAATWPHRRIAETLHREFKVGDWWAQTVAVGYERIKGLREIGQRRSGAYEASRSKTFPVPVEKLYRAFADARTRNRWLPGIRLTVRTATSPKSIRFTWDDGTSMQAWFIAKGQAKSTVQITHLKLGGKEDAAKRKEFWGDQLDALARVLT